MPLKLVYRSSAFYGILITYVTRNALYYAITGQLIIYLVGSGVSPTAAAFSISIFSASSLIGRFITGFISGTILKPRTCTAGCNILMGIGMLLINAMPSASAIYFCTALMGLGLGAGFVGMPLCISHFFGSNNFSIINGTISPINYIIGASGPLLVSILATYTGSYGVAFSILSVIAIFGGIVLLRIKQPDYRPEKNFQ